MMQKTHRNLKFWIVFCLLTGVIPSCTNKPEISSEQVGQMIDNWHQAASLADFDAYFGMLGDQSIFIGTDAHERWTKKEFQDFAKPYFDEGETWDFKVTSRNVQFAESGNVIYFDELLDTWMGTCRGSGVMELVDKEWKIMHYHLAITVPNELIQEFLGLMETRKMN